MAPPWKVPSPSTKSTVTQVPASTTTHACWWASQAAAALSNRSIPVIVSGSRCCPIGAGRSSPICQMSREVWSAIATEIDFAASSFEEAMTIWPISASSSDQHDNAASTMLAVSLEGKLFLFVISPQVTDATVVLVFPAAIARNVTSVLIYILYRCYASRSWQRQQLLMVFHSLQR